jgi:hypothetical protein
VSRWIVHHYRDTEFCYQTNYDPDTDQWFARGYVTWPKGQSWEVKIHTTPYMSTEIEAKQAFCEWAMRWIDDNP